MMLSILKAWLAWQKRMRADTDPEWASYSEYLAEFRKQTLYLPSFHPQRGLEVFPFPLDPRD